MSKAKLTVLDNGLRIITGSMPGMTSTAIGVWADVGSRYETPKLAGASHFLEHLLFKGTKKRTSKQITEAIEGVGGLLNAFTSEEHTCYMVKVHHRHVGKGVEILSDMILNSTFEPKEIARERGVIIEEMNMSKDNPSEYVQELLNGRLWPDQPLGRLIIGSKETVLGMKRQEIIDYKKQHYVSGNMVITAAGNLDHGTFVRLARKWFSRLPSGTRTKFKPATKGNKGARSGIAAQKTEQVHVAMAFPAYHRMDPDRWIAKLLSTVLGENMSSRLFQEVREKRGFAYDISSAVSRYHDAGSLSIYAGTESGKFLSCLQTISKVLRELKKNGIQQGELDRAKEYTIGRFTLSLERSMDNMLWLGEHLITEGEIPRLEKILRQIKHVSARDIQRAAKNIFKSDALCVQAIGHGLSKNAMLKQFNF